MGMNPFLAYSKNKDSFKNTVNKIPKSKEQIKAYKNPDNDPRGAWVSSDYTAQGFRT